MTDEGVCHVLSEDGERIAPVLIVDGYNIVGAWPRLNKYFQVGLLDTARERLMSDLGEYMHYKGACVFLNPQSLTHPHLTHRCMRCMWRMCRPT